MMPKHPFIIALFLLVSCAPSANTPPAPSSSPNASASPAEGFSVTFADIQPIIEQRCQACHSQTPSRPGFGGPAGGVSLDTPEQIQTKADRIRARSVQTKGMPQGNVTNMTDEEREKLGKWIEQGAKL